MEDKFDITEEDLRKVREKAASIESEGITIHDTDLGRDITKANNKGRKPIRLREKSYEVFRRIAGAIASIKSKFSKLKEQDYSEDFQEAVEQTFDSEGPVVIASDDKEMESWKNFAENLKNEGTLASEEPEVEEIVSVAKEDSEGLTDISGIISDSNTDEKVSKERENFDVWFEEQKKKEDEFNDIRVKSAVKPIKDLEVEKIDHTVGTNLEDKKEVSSEESIAGIDSETGLEASLEGQRVVIHGPKKQEFGDFAESDTLSFGSIFDQIQKNSEEIKEEQRSTSSISQQTDSTQDETYEQKVQRLTREIEQKKRELAQQQQINASTQEAIDRQKKITSKVLASAEALKSENERIKAENIANLESAYASAEAECTDAVSESHVLEEELKEAQKHQTEATVKMRALQAINDELRKSRSEIESMSSKNGSPKRR